jgi:hypothetical protein
MNLTAGSASLLWRSAGGSGLAELGEQRGHRDHDVLGRDGRQHARGRDHELEVVPRRGGSRTSTLPIPAMAVIAGAQLDAGFCRARGLEGAALELECIA